MDQELLTKLEEQDKKLDSILKSVERTRKIFLWTLIIAVATVVLPLMVLPFLVPVLLQSISPALYGL